MDEKNFYLELIEKKNYNNFYERLPSGWYRTLDTAIADERQSVLFEDIDVILEERGFDFESLKLWRQLSTEVGNMLSHYIDRTRGRGINPSESEIEEYERKQQESSRAREKLDIMIGPVIEKLLDMGYTAKELIG
jgi:hypothetical protein